jgi:hypothetical protein
VEDNRVHEKVSRSTSGLTSARAVQTTTKVSSSVTVSSVICSSIGKHVKYDSSHVKYVVKEKNLGAVLSPGSS